MAVKKQQAFEGYFEETVDFLWGIRMNNYRSWYMDHKDDCVRYLTGPTSALASEVQQVYAERAPELDLNVHVSRIYRDARRNYNKGPYKDYLWFTLYDANHEHWSGIPSFFFEISAEYWNYGVGFWDNRTQLMEKLRKRIKADPERLRILDQRLREQNEFTLQEDLYKKQYSDCPYPELDRWYRNKRISITHMEPVGPAILGTQFGDRIKEGMLFLKPYYEYIFELQTELDAEGILNDEEY